jgi:hypothetical protein
MKLNTLIFLVPGEGFEPSWDCSLRILSPLQPSLPKTALSRTSAHIPRMTRLCAFGLDCIETHKPHWISAGGATQTATEGNNAAGGPIRPWDAGDSLQLRSSGELAGTHFEHFCGYLCRLPDCRVEDKRLALHPKNLLSFSRTLITVLVRLKATLYVFLGQFLFLHKLCVAHPRAQGASNENSSGVSHCLRFVLPTCVYASCHAHRCAGSRTVRPGRRSNSVSPALWSPGNGPLDRQAKEVSFRQGASFRGRLAH